MRRIRVLLAEDHTIVRKGIRSLLEGEPDIEVVGEAGNGREALEKVEKLLPDVVVMDISMPILSGLEATRFIAKKFPEIKVLALTVHTNEEYILQLLRLGASGYLVKQAAPEELVAAIKAVFRGDCFLSPVISGHVIDGYARLAKMMETTERYEKLTNREREILQLIAEGHTNKEIARMLYLSVKTVETHRARLMKKLDIHSASELTRYAIQKGIIRPEK